jgi:predicted ATPase
MARLTGIGVGGFKSIKDLQLLPLRPINVFVGANGAGKSNLISFFRLLASIPGLGLQRHVGSAGGPNALLYYGVKQTPALWASLEFEGKAGQGKYLFSLRSTAIDSLIFSYEDVDTAIVKGGHSKRFQLGSGHKESLLLEGENEFTEVWDLLSDIQVFHFEDTSEAASIRVRGYVHDSRYLQNDGRNLAAFLYSLQRRKPAYYRRIVKTIQQIAPFFDDFDLAPIQEDPNNILLNWRDRDSDYLFGPHQLSDGTLRSMALVTLLAQPEKELPGLIVIDEPEIGLHPYSLEVLAGLVKGASVHRPIILATQSAALVNQFAAEDVVTVTREGAQSKFQRQNSGALASWLEEYAVGEIWEKNLIGGTPSR